jgi:hypothetical protein
MSEILKTLLPVITLLAGFFLNEWTKHKGTTKEENKKRKRLVYLLLDLRHQFFLRANYDHMVNAVLTCMIEQIKRSVPIPEIDRIPAQFLDIIKASLKQKIPFRDTSPEINNVLPEISEIDPGLAYRLKDSFNYSEKTMIFNGYIDEVIQQVEDQPPPQLTERMSNLFLENMIKDIGEVIKEITSSLEKKDRTKILDILNAQMSNEIDPEEVKRLVDSMLVKLFAFIEEGTIT